MLESIKNNKAFKTIFIVGLIIILIITLLKLFISFNNGLNKFTMINMHHFGKEDIVVRYKHIPQSDYGHVSTYLVWLYIEDYEYNLNKAKHIFHIGDKNMSVVSPGVWFYPKTNNLAVKFSVQGKEVAFTDGVLGKAKADKKCIFPYKINWKALKMQRPNNKDPDMKIYNCETTADKFSKHGYCPTEVDSKGYVVDINKFGSCKKKSMDPNFNKGLLDLKGNCDIENVPLKRWFHLGIAVKDDSASIYIDGKLIKTCVYENLPLISKGSLWITNKGGFNGSLTQLKVIPYYLGTKDIRTIYHRGPFNKHTLLGSIPSINSIPSFNSVSSFNLVSDESKECK